MTKTRAMLRVISISLLAVFLAAGNAIAGQTAAAGEKEYFSPNHRYKLRVIPRPIQSPMHYFHDKARGLEPAGAVDMEDPGYCKGEFFMLIDGEYHLMWRTRLANDVAPAGAVVSDNGRHVVTFDNWHGSGYGDNVVVIYGDFGGLLFKLGLEDILTEAQIRSHVLHTTGSRWWRTGEGSIRDSVFAIRTVAGETALSLKNGRPLQGQ